MKNKYEIFINIIKMNTDKKKLKIKDDIKKKQILKMDTKNEMQARKDILKNEIKGKSKNRNAFNCKMMVNDKQLKRIYNFL